ncbi:MAG: urease accessory protein UreD [Pigmentiphaga sp.]|nr:urease accessory protein UreD [Pigmentiphaga sp.]
MAITEHARTTQRHWHARLDLGFTLDGNRRSVLSKREHEGPVLIQRALYPEGPGVCHAVLLHPPSGIAGGDLIDIDISVGQGAHAALTTPGATRWYKSNGRQARQTARLHVAAGGRLDWLPMENIYFEQTDAVQQTEILLDSDAAAIGWEMTQLGSILSATHWDEGTVFSSITLRVDGQMLWVDQGRLDAGSPLRQSVAGLAGQPVFGTLWCYGDALSPAAIEALAGTLPWHDALRGGLTEIASEGGKALVLVRAIGLHAEDVRELLTTTWQRLRPEVLSVEGQRLRLWST